MYNEKQLRGIKVFCANKYWGAIFRNAPSDEARRYYAESWAFSIDLSVGKEHSEILEEIFRNLSDEDWDYIISRCHNGMGRWGLECNRRKWGKGAVQPGRRAKV